VALTAAGAVLQEEARFLLERLGQAVEAAKRADRGELGVLRLGYVPAMIGTELPDIVRKFRGRFPNVQLQLNEMNPATQLEALLAGTLDVGFVRGPVHEPDLATQTVFEEQLLVALPAGHRLAWQRRVRLAMLATEPFVLPARLRGPGWHDHVLSLCRNAGFSPKVVQEGSMGEIVSLVASGAGVAIVGESSRSFRQRGVAYRRLRERATSKIEMVWSRKRVRPVLCAFLEEIELRGKRGIGPS
jgi:DNA-binding transcriptional LysR family regulator